MNGYLIAALMVVAYFAVLVVGHRSGAWRRLGISLYGPVLMLKTSRGKRLIDRLARAESFWTWYGNLSTALTLAVMAAVTIFLVYQAMNLGDEAADPDTLYSQSIKLPQAGLWLSAIYIVAGFALAIAVHEYAHGILTVVGKIKLASMGLLLLVIPIGAFVEPDDKDLKASTIKRRARLFAAGPATNMIAAGVILGALIWVVGPSATPIANGAVVTGLAPNSPAAIYGIGTWSEILSVEGQPVLDATQMSQVSFAEPGEMVRVIMLYDSEFVSLEVPGGVVVYTVMDGPGHDAGLEPGMIIRSLNDTPINTMAEFRSVTENASRNVPVNMTVLRYSQELLPDRGEFVEDTRITSVNLTSKWLYYRTHYPWMNREEYRNVSFMAVSVSPMGIRAEDPDYLTDIVARPFDSVDGAGDIGQRFQRFVSIPFIGYTPVVSPATDLYDSSGAMSFIPGELLWVIINFLYWAFWANFVLGISNALPALPFDGGYVLRDALKGVGRWWDRRLSGLDRVIGRGFLTDRQIDDLMLFISGMVVIMVVYLLLAGTWGGI